MGQSYNRRMPTTFYTVSKSKKELASEDGFAMFAPLWTDANFQKGHVRYHIYDRTNTRLGEGEKYLQKHVLQLAKEDAHNYGGSSALDPSWVMVVTWEGSMPRMSYHSYYYWYYEQVSLDEFTIITITSNLLNFFLMLKFHN